MTEKNKTIKVAFVGNPNCGKTTLFNAVTGSRLKVANWPGVTVEKKEGAAEYEDCSLTIIDTPGIYSLTCYTIEEICLPRASLVPLTCMIMAPFFLRFKILTRVPSLIPRACSRRLTASSTNTPTTSCNLYT